MARNLSPAEREARLEAIRRQNEADAKRARLLTTVAVVISVVLVGVVVLVIALNARDTGTEPAEVAYPEGTVLVDPDEPASGGFVVGRTGRVDLVVYEDYQCPACRAFEAEAGEYLAELAEGEDVTLVRRPVAILDRTNDGYSSRAAAAAACVGEQDPDALEEWAAQVFAEQPAEGGSGLPDSRLVELAEAAGADVAACVEAGTYLPWAEATTAAAGRELDRLATPTVLLDGEVVTGAEGGYPSVPELQEAVEAALAGAGEDG